MSHLILEHLKNCKEYILIRSKAIGIADHRGNIGSAREALITQFLQNNLPKAINYSSGELFDSNGAKSGQIDIVLSPNTAPQINLFDNYNLTAVDTTLGVIEVKSDLSTGKTGTLTGALDNCCKVKKLKKVNGGKLELSTTTIDLGTVPYLVFALKGSKYKAVLKTIDRYLNRKELTFKEAPDIITVVDQGYYLIKQKNWFFNEAAEAKDIYKSVEAEEHTLLGIYDFILSLSEHLSESPQDFKMPLKRYTEKMETLLADVSDYF